MYEDRPIYMDKDLYNEKRPKKRVPSKRPICMERDLYTEKRPI